MDRSGRVLGHTWHEGRMLEAGGGQAGSVGTERGEIRKGLSIKTKCAQNVTKDVLPCILIKPECFYLLLVSVVGLHTFHGQT